MNYIIKGVLKKILREYLFINDDGFDIESGIVKLPSGIINHERINVKLKTLNLRLQSSSYKNLIVHVPIMELLSKPIKISIETLDVVIHKINEEGQANRKQSESQTQENNQPNSNKKEEQKGQKQDQIKSQNDKQNSGYFKNIINRLLYNMEIYMEKINIKMIDNKETQEFRQAFFTIHSMYLKNSLVILEANIIKKTLNLNLLHIRHSLAQFQIKDLNLCLDFNNKKLTIIVILGSIATDFYKIPMKHLSKKLTKKLSQNLIIKEQKVPRKEADQKIVDLNVLIKINGSKISSKLIKAQMSTIELKLKKNQEDEQLFITFQSIKVNNWESSDEKQNNNLIQIGYLPLCNDIKIYSQFEDSIIKNSFIFVKRETHLAQTSISAKIYHLMIKFNVNQCKILLDNILKFQKQIFIINKFVKRLTLSKFQNKQKPYPKQDKGQKHKLNLLIYRILIQIKYNEMKIRLFSTVTFKNGAFQQKIDEHEHLLNFQLQKLKSIKEARRISEQQKINLKGANYRLKMFQFGINISNYKVCELNEIQCCFQGNQLIINCCSLNSQVSLSLFDKLMLAKTEALRDILYYSQKLKLLLIQQNQQLNVPQLINNSQIQIERQNQIPLNETKFPKIYVKINQILFKLGQLTFEKIVQQPQNKRQKQKIVEQITFISILQVQFINTLFSFKSNKIKLKTDFITYIYSPYTLQRSPITNELHYNINYNITSQELNISLKNKLVVLIEDQFINIIYKLFDKQQVWCQFKNLTHQKVKFVQLIHSFRPLIRNKNYQQGNQSNQNDENFHIISIKPYQKRSIFWLNDSEFTLQVGDKQSQSISLNKSQELQLNSNDLFYQVTKQLKFTNISENLFILKLVYNKLGNLLELTLDYRVHVASYSADFEVILNGSKYIIKHDPQFITNPKLSRISDGHWFHLLEDLSEDLKKIKIVQKQVVFDLQNLMANEEFAIYGLFKKSQNIQEKRSKVFYEFYILQQNINKGLYFFIMPFLIIKNQLSCKIQLQIIDKKSQQKENVLLERGETKQLNKSQKFDFYMKQFTFKITIINEQNKPSFESDCFYFNTFFMVDQKTETSIKLSSTKKQNYSKQTIIFEQDLLYKTKLITLKNGIKFNNLTDFNFCFRVKYLHKQQNDINEIYIERKSQKQWSCKLKRDCILQIMINNQVQNKIEIPYTQIYDPKILSFNFFKINQKYYNILVKIHRRNLEGTQYIELQDFVELINICRYVENIQIEDQQRINYDQKVNLPLNSTSLSKYNNKYLQIDDINKIYGEIFLTAKVTNDPLKIKLNDNIIIFTQLIKQSSQELQIGSNRYIFTLLKDMNYNRITFYITDKLYNKNMNYTLFNNVSQKYFLLSDDSEYSHHFIVQSQANSSTPPQKIFIQKNSFNCFINKQNFDILFCDQYQKHLEKIDKKLLDKQNIKLQQYNFQSITLIDCNEEPTLQQAKRQLSTKSIQIRIKMFKKMELSLSIRSLTVRQLQKNKLDCLIQDISIKNQQSKDHLLRIPEQTYILLQGKILHKKNFLLLKNIFIKCKNIIVNIKRQMPYSIINLMNNLSQRMGFKAPEEEEALEPRKYRQKLKKLNGQNKLKSYINQMLLLVKNIYIHQIHLSLTIELENLSFSNVIILPQYEITDKFTRQNSFKNQITTFYLSNLLAKFPKLSFLMTNFKSPRNTIKLFFSIREAMKEKVEAQHIIYFRHQQIPQNPFVFSIQRWNVITNKLVNNLSRMPLKEKEKLISYIYQNKNYLILTNYNILWVQDGQSHSLQLKQLQNIRIINNRVNSEIIMKFKNGEKLMLIEQEKKCLQILNNIKKIVL